MSFKLWSQSNATAKSFLKPDLGLRSWDELSNDEKNRIWKHLERHFFDKDSKYGDPHSQYMKFNIDFAVVKGEYYYEFFDPYSHNKAARIEFAIGFMNYYYKAGNYTPEFLQDPSKFSACIDFFSIFTKYPHDVVLEMLSMYCKSLISEREGKFEFNTPIGVHEDFEKGKEKWEWSNFDEFASDLNNVFSDFGLNVHLTRNGFIPKQDEKIVEDIYIPVLNFFSEDKWKVVNNYLAESFVEHRKNTPEGYSTCITKTVTAIQAFLQLRVNGAIGKGDISKLIKEAQGKNLIPSDIFSMEIFKNIETILARERQEKGDPHPRKEFANEKNARLVLNLAMVFFQHCI